MPKMKTAAPVRQHRNGQKCEISTYHTFILPHAAPIFKCVLKNAANFTMLACTFGAVCALCGLIEGGGTESLTGLAACLLGSWGAVKVREVIVHG